MEDTIAEIGSRCASVLESYMTCVDKNRDTWQTACHTEKLAVSECAGENEVLKKVKTGCASQITTYQKCLSENASQPDLCGGALKKLYECHRSVAGIYEPKA